MLNNLISSPDRSQPDPDNPAFDITQEEVPAPVLDLSSPPLEDSVDSHSLPAIDTPDTISAASSTPQPPYPQLKNLPLSSSPVPHFNKDEEPSVPKPFDCSSSPQCPDDNHDDSDNNHDDDDDDGDDDDTSSVSPHNLRRMHRFTLYETTTRYYIVGSDIQDAQFRVIKIDRTADEGELSIIEDEVVYNRAEMTRLLATIEDGNRATGGLKTRLSFWGLLGFIRFTTIYYMLLITKRSVVAIIGGHYVYQIDDTELIPLTTDVMLKKNETNTEEARFVGILQTLDLTRSFYFSYAYDITRTLQHNIIRQREALAKGEPHEDEHDFNDMFTWNHYLLEPAKTAIKNPYDWCIPIIHGYVDQSNISVYGRSIYITIIARRSRYFAGARFLKRGANDLGYVANDVETEQIVSEMITTSFHAPGKKLYANPNYTSYVQHRGSIPLFWTQKNDAATPKPPVEMNLVDPFYSAAALHFDNLFERYGAPVIVLNLVKARERTPRESLLLHEFTQAIRYLNQFLPSDHKITYIAWDMSRAAKSRDQDVITTLEDIATSILSTTSFFHNHPLTPRLQSGIARTNCIDCLDRTNAAQFVLGKRALALQLHSLGVLPTPSTLAYDTDAVDLFTHMYHDHGDTIAVQYAGSHLVNTMETYRKINQWKSHPRDMLESFKRYYNNSFLDAQRQEAYNLFLGNYIFTQGQPMLWDLSTDYYLHHADPRLSRPRRRYDKWWTPANLKPRSIPPLPDLSNTPFAGKPLSWFDDYWMEYYRPKLITSFGRVFACNINSTLKYLPKAAKEGKYDLSPFVVRTSRDPIPATVQAPTSPNASRGKKKIRKGILEFPSFAETPSEPEPEKITEKTTTTTRRRRAWSLPLHPQLPNSPPQAPEPAATLTPAVSDVPTLVADALEPKISASEKDEYQRYTVYHLVSPFPLPITINPSLLTDPRSENVRYVTGTSWEKEVGEQDRSIYETAVEAGGRGIVWGVGREAGDADEGDREEERRRWRAYGKWVKGGRMGRGRGAGGDGKPVG